MFRKFENPSHFSKIVHTSDKIRESFTPLVEIRRKSKLSKFFKSVDYAEHNLFGSGSSKGNIIKLFYQFVWGLSAMALVSRRCC
jgi:hypothetical protein